MTLAKDPTSEPLHRLRAISNPVGYSYLLSQPRATIVDPARRWPLIVFLHGAAERGAQVTDVARQGLPKLLSGDPGLNANESAAGREVAETFVIVAPQCAHFEVWNEIQLLALIDSLPAELRV